MNDNFFLEDLLHSLRESTTTERYWPLIPYREELLSFLKEQKLNFRDEVTDSGLPLLHERFGAEITGLFTRYLHLYDFKKEKLREIRQYQGTERYDPLAGLLRLPGVRILRAELYYNSGVTIEILAEKPTDEIRTMVRDYIEREGRREIVPLSKEVNCHKEVAKMILHAARASH